MRTGRMGLRTYSNRSNHSPGRNTLAASATVQRSSGMMQSASVATTASKWASVKGRFWASPAQIYSMPLSPPAAADLEHLCAQFDAGEMYAGGIEVEIPAPAEGYLQHLAMRPRAGSLPAGPQEHPFEKGGEPVVALGPLVVVPPDSLRPVSVHAHPGAGLSSSRRPRTTRSRSTPPSSATLGKCAQGSKPNILNSSKLGSLWAKAPAIRVFRPRAGAQRMASASRRCPIPFRRYSAAT